MHFKRVSNGCALTCGKTGLIITTGNSQRLTPGEAGFDLVPPFDFFGFA